MVRSNGRKRRGVQRDAGKLKRVRVNRKHSSIFITKNIQQLMEKVAQKLFNIFATISCAIYSAPLRKTGHNQFEVLKGKQKFVFYLMSAVAAGCFAHKVKAYASLLNNGSTFDFTTFLAFVTVLYYFVPYATAVGVLIKPKETAVLIHDWPNVLLCLEDPIDTKLTPFSDISAAWKVVIVAGGVTMSLLGALTNYLCVDSLPFYFHTQFRDDFCDLYSILPGLVWRIIFLSIDVCSICVAQPLIGFVGMMLSMEFGTLKAYIKELSTITVNARSHAKVHHLYNCFRIHNALTAEWFKVGVCPIIFSQSLTIIICLYMAIKHPEMPALILASFLGTAFALLVILFWSGFDMFAITKGGEGVIQSLQELKHFDFMRMTKMQKREYLKRAVAMRKPSFPVGNFSEMNFDVLIAVWEEMLNQLLFLLTF